MDTDFPQRFSDALVSEIKAEMGRQDLSSRALGRLIGASSQYMSARLDGGNPRTGERVLLTVKDISAIASALGLSELDLVARAHRVASQPTNVTTLHRRSDSPSDLTAEDLIDFVETPELDDLRLAAKRGKRKADEEPWAE